MRIVLVPYKMGSASGKAIKDAINATNQHTCIRVNPQNTRYRPRNTDRVIYYGGNQVLQNEPPTVLNKTRTVASNKLMTLQACKEQELSTVPWTTNHENIPTDWSSIVCRATLNGHSGDGITIVSRGDTIPIVPLYTKYIKKTYECRIHIFNGRMIDAQIKRKVRDVEEANTLIRNIHTGWIYCRENYTADPRAIELAIATVNACGLNFGAVDLIYNQHYNQFYILEVNTAPGLTGTTLNNYVTAFLGDM